ncbi:MAG: TonB-dependent receptor plug domain-containing protein [Opitutaceae bacterium]|nr:TonB-dependent receptor plug domain-containing protein [Opitutaceae bacterium]
MNFAPWLNLPPLVRTVPASVVVILLAALSLRAQTVPPAPAVSPPAKAGDTIELTPFTVSTDRDEGFAATSALAGGRLATDLRDTPAAYSVITREFIDALNLTDLQSAAEWSTGSDSIPNNGDATFFTFSTYYQTRGVRAGTQQRNFFPQYGDNDTFDIERIDFGRGPNSILFGNGTLGGTSSSTTKRARTDRAFQTVQLSAGSWSTYRATFDVNQPLGARAALRTAGVWGDGDGWREKDFNRRKGVFATTTFRPWRNTEIRLEGEYLEIQKQTGMTTLNDRLSGWNGALTYNTPTALRGAAAAVLTAATAAGVNRRGANYYVWNPYGGLNAIVNLEGEPMTRAGGETATTPIAGYTYGAIGAPSFNTAGATFGHTVGIPSSRFDNAIAYSFFRVPDDEFTLSPDAPLLSSRFKDLQLTINQRFGDFYFEAAADINRQAYFVNGEENRGTQDSYIDINRVLADGSANPHFLQPYGDGSFFRGFRNYEFDSIRFAAAYVKNTRFGKFTVNTMGGRSENHYTLSYRWLSLAQGADQSQWILPAQFIRVRRYWNESAREITDLSRSSVRYLNPGVTNTQIQPRWVIDNSRYDTETINDANYKYGLVALNAKFWRDRLVVLGAVRRDQYFTASQQQVRQGDYPTDWDPAQPLFRPAAPSDWATLTYVPKDAQGRPTGPAQPATARPRATNRSRLAQYAGDRFQDDFNAPPLEGYQTTKSTGAVFHVARWLSPFVNYAETFNPASAYNVLIDGNLVPPTVAKGLDVGTRVELFQGKLNLSFTYYQNEEENRAASISGGPPINTLYRAIPQGSTNPLNNRGQNLIPTYVDLSTRHGTGYEIEATANLTKGFRLTGSVAVPRIYLDDANAMTRAYIDRNAGVIRQIAEDASVRVDPTTNIASVNAAIPANVRSPDAQAAADAYNQIFQFRRSQIEGRILDQKQPLVKLFADYTFQSGRLKGLRGGLGVRYSGKRIIGDRANDTMRDPTNPTRAIDDPERSVYTMVYAPEDSTTVTGTLGYSFRLFERQVQANLVVNNLLNDRSVTYLGTVQRPRDGDYTSPAREAVPNGFSFKQPINFNLTVTVRM